MDTIFKNALLEQNEVPEAILVSVFPKGEDPSDREASLAELERLLETAGGRTFAKLVQYKDHPENATYIGSGKMQELANLCQTGGVELVICDDELSPIQIRNMENALGGDVRVIDRSMLILDIFALHAATADGKLQVELAQYQYLLPRLVGMWTHLERQRGGIGMRGPGETQIETDRRIILDRISRLKAQLADIAKQKEVQRKNRGKLTRVALVGYTNAGKTTLMNLLIKSNVFAENKLFATLDTTVRKVTIDNLPFLLTDTVGFIRKLPTHLVDSFKSTLDEVREADILVHVVDVSHPQFEEQIEVVDKTLRDICGKQEKPVIMVFNKIDAFTYTPTTSPPPLARISRSKTSSAAGRRRPTATASSSPPRSAST